MARPTSSESCASSGHSACGPASERTKAVAASRSRRSAFRSASIRAPPPGCGCETATRPSTAPPSSSAFMPSIAKRFGATLTSPRSRSGFWLRKARSVRPCSHIISASGSAEFDAERGLEIVGRGVLRARPAQRHPCRAGRAEFEPANGPGAGAGVEFGGDILQRTPAQHDLFGGEFDLRRRSASAGCPTAARASPAGRAPARTYCPSCREPVGIELPRGQRRTQQAATRQS